MVDARMHVCTQGYTHKVEIIETYVPLQLIQRPYVIGICRGVVPLPNQSNASILVMQVVASKAPEIPAKGVASPFVGLR